MSGRQRTLIVLLMIVAGLGVVYVVATADRVLPSLGETLSSRLPQATASPPRSRDASATASEIEVFAGACGDLLKRDYVPALRELSAPDWYLGRYRDRLVDLITAYRDSLRDATTRQQVLQAFERHLDSVAPLILEYDADLTPVLVAAGCWPTTSLGGYYQRIAQTWERQWTWEYHNPR